jgi:hypothetical protein
VIIEASSPATETYNSEGKFLAHLSIKNFQEHLLWRGIKPHLIEIRRLM